MLAGVVSEPSPNLSYESFDVPTREGRGCRVLALVLLSVVVFGCPVSCGACYYLDRSATPPPQTRT